MLEGVLGWCDCRLVYHDVVLFLIPGSCLHTKTSRSTFLAVSKLILYLPLCHKSTFIDLESAFISHVLSFWGTRNEFAHERLWRLSAQEGREHGTTIMNAMIDKEPKENDLESTPETLDRALTQMFSLSSRWNAIVLIDEADRMGAREIGRNGMVTDSCGKLCASNCFVLAYILTTI
jgi:hypothetical protein